MKLELFTVYLKEGGKINLEINERTLKAYGLTLEEFSKKYDSNSLSLAIKDFIECIEKSKS